MSLVLPASTNIVLCSFLTKTNIETKVIIFKLCLHESTHPFVCHRFDQSLWIILVTNAYNFDKSKYRPKTPELIASANRETKAWNGQESVEEARKMAQKLKEAVLN